MACPRVVIHDASARFNGAISAIRPWRIGASSAKLCGPTGCGQGTVPSAYDTTIGLRSLRESRRMEVK
ncbi:uncharacterized protein SCHCODRAFT_01218106 [Schizophyllum commune H4-8]|uniref:uncharacterized protein n=1 Tax=Schizophyllum commune (strain H4-8 / FGSC 9210) TaxID=578458 RepID=UPI00215E9387|nr:uncharacterized protein SCHCODRAFT_01218106 [Schizophyllum commune H4-8]KAI5886704.1 hypothetical protein SCHCODRAFT_01218106 [Schizophyllum commune H4-8]